MSPVSDITGVILCGGRSSRFGQNKALAHVRGVPMVKRVLEVMRLLFAPLLMVTNRPEEYAAFNIPMVSDLVPDRGPMEGIVTAFHHSSNDRLFVVACDMPFLTAPFLRHLAARGRDADLAIPRTAGGYEPLCASYARACADPICRLLDEGRLRAADVVVAGVRVCELGPDELATFDPDGTLFVNVNTPRDYERALDALVRRSR